MARPKQPKHEKKYTVKATLRALELQKNTGKALTVKIFADEQLGTLEIGQGSFRWFKKKAKKPTKILEWAQFADKMNE